MRKVFAVLALLFPVVSQAWWNDEWNFRKEITFDSTATGANIPGTLQEFAIPIRLHAGNFGYFGDTKPDGSDLRFIDGDDKTPLKYHIERYDAVNQLAYLWVRVPRITGANNSSKIFLYYGNKKAPGAADAPGTYDKNQAMVLHFLDGDAQPVDATANANKPNKSTAEVTAASLIAGGLKFNGTQSVSVPAGSALRLAPAAGATMSVWLRQEAATADAYVLALQDGNTEFMIGIRGSKPYARVVSPAGRAEVPASTDVAAATWHHVAATVGGSKLTLYVDGAVVATAPAQAAEIGGQLTIGAGATGDHGFTGEMDEVQFSNSVRAPEWILASARSQGQEAPLVVYGADAQKEGQKVSYFSVTLQNVTPDGWVVIIILAVMLLIAFAVMGTKAIYLSRVRGGNARFLTDFEDRRDDSAASEERGDKFGKSTLFVLYQHGMKELAKRVNAAPTKQAGPSLTPQAIEAIRAKMDASLVRMTQKLASNMVLLTIAIAGGPFLGLLGTVVGVMITFAAIAASGDVNVNSIAPGIAAALVATVAGLGVAIPSLFGYNWLNTRIKETGADMRVFVDEFVTRIAERHS